MHTLTVAKLRAKAHKAGIFGNGGGWVQIGRKNIQSWNSVGVFLDEMRKRLPWNLKEIVDGRRVGIPTLSRIDTLEVVAGLLSPDPVSWRD